MSTAVFYDLENISIFTTPKNHGEFMRSVEEIKKSPLVDDIVMQRAYISKTHTAYVKYKSFLDSTGIEICGVDPKMNANKSNLVDFKMNVDITACALSNNIDTVVIATGDGDFGFLCEELKSSGKKVVIASYGITTNKSIVMLCDDWVDFSGKYVLSDISELCRNRLEYRRCCDYRTAVRTLIEMMRSDVLINRYMEKGGIPLEDFVALSRRLCRPPEIEELDISLEEFIKLLLEGENIDIVEAGGEKTLVYADTPLKTGVYALYERISGLDDEFSKDSFRAWHEWFSENIDSIPELVYYLKFLTSNSMLTISGENASLTPIRKCAATLTEQTSKKLERLRLTPDPKELAKLKTRFYRNAAPKKETAVAEEEPVKTEELYTQAIKTNFGRVVVQATEEAVVSVSVTNKFMKYRHNEITSLAVREIRDYFKGERKEFTVPVAPRGTEFQKKVWSALCDIPYGETKTYKEIAAEIGKPKAVRAVGAACNKNPVMLIVPCHRVVGSNGSLTGYAGGLDMKEALLEGEKDPENFRRYGRQFSNARMKQNAENASEETASEKTVSEETASEKTVSEENASEETVSGKNAAENENAVSEEVKATEEVPAAEAAAEETAVSEETPKRETEEKKAEPKKPRANRYARKRVYKRRANRQNAEK